MSPVIISTVIPSEQQQPDWLNEWRAALPLAPPPPPPPSRSSEHMNQQQWQIAAIAAVMLLFVARWRCYTPSQADRVRYETPILHVPDQVRAKRSKRAIKMTGSGSNGVTRGRRADSCMCKPTGLTPQRAVDASGRPPDRPGTTFAVPADRTASSWVVDLDAPKVAIAHAQHGNATVLTMIGPTRALRLVAGGWRPMLAKSRRGP